jgi:hypothetical protein
VKKYLIIYLSGKKKLQAEIIERDERKVLTRFYESYSGFILELRYYFG